MLKTRGFEGDSRQAGPVRPVYNADQPITALKGTGIRTLGAYSRRVGPLGGMGTVTEAAAGSPETVPYLRGDRAFESQQWKRVGACLRLCLG